MVHKANGLNNANSNDYLVSIMCDRSEPEISDVQKKFFEPGCGCGNILAEVLLRRLRNANHDPRKVLLAVSNIYGLDTDHDIISIARHRLFSLCKDYLAEVSATSYRTMPILENIIQHNIIIADFLKHDAEIKFCDWRIGASDGHVTYTTWSLRKILEMVSSEVDA